MIPNKRSGVLLLSLRNHLVKSFCSNVEEKEILITNATPYFTKLMINKPSTLNALTYSMAKNIRELTSVWNKSSPKVQNLI